MAILVRLHSTYIYVNCTLFDVSADSPPFLTRMAEQSPDFYKGNQFCIIQSINNVTAGFKIFGILFQWSIMGTFDFDVILL